MKSPFVPLKSEILELNINWNYISDVVGAKPTPIATVDFKIKLSNGKTSHIMQGSHLVGEVSVNVYEDKK
jgi:hypothetical protein